MPFFRTINAIRYHYELVGQGPPLVLLHGFTGSSENWQRVVAHLQDHSCLLTVDLLGHGQTEAPVDAERYAMAHAAADVIALVDTMIGKSCHLLGYSMGGRLALYLALSYPDRFRSLILESASPGLASEAERRDRQQRDNNLADQIEQGGIEAFVNYWETLPLFSSQQNLLPATQQQLRAQRLKHRPIGLANSLRGMGIGVQPSLWEQLPDMQLPVLLIAGGLDTKFVSIAHQMYDLLPRAHKVIVPDAGHTVHLEQPEAFCQVISDFLKGD
jgi:2-succinyl-6-hydroxy-2,4-cyclohexadiene-1-carboxylate synthase